MKSKTEKPDNLISLRDYRVVRDQALEEGYCLNDYLARARELGIDREKLINNSYSKKTLGNFIEDRNKKQKRRRLIKKAVAVLAAPFIAYMGNFGIMSAVAEVQAPEGFHDQYPRYLESRKALGNLEEKGGFMVSGQYVLAAQELLGEKYWDMLTFGPVAWKYEETRAKAINPLKHI